MEVIDEEGRVFGVVNVIDAIVVLLVVAVVVAGLALVFGGGDTGPDGGATPLPNTTNQPLETTHATVDLGTHPRLVGRLVEPENVTAGGHPATITDVYRTPAGSDRVRILARVEFDGNRTERGFVVGEDTGTPLTLRYGVSLGLTTADYRVNGQVTTIGDDAEFDTRERRVVLNVSTSRTVAAAISAGDTHRIAGHAVATVERVERTAHDNETVHLEVTLAVEALETDGSVEYAGGPLRLGRTLAFATDRYAIRGTVVEIG